MNKTICTLLTAILTSTGLMAHETGVVPPSPARKALYGGDYPTALKLYQDEVRKNPTDAAAKGMYARLKKAVRDQEDFARESNKAQKLKIGSALRQFYFDFNDFERALSVDEEIYKLDASPANALFLAESCLNTNRNKEAKELLDSLADDPDQSRLALMKVLAGVRNGQTEPAEKLLAEKSFKDFKKLKDLLLYAGIAARSGDTKTASAAMSYVLANVPAKMHWQIRNAIENNPDFAAALKDEAFTKAMQTESKVKEKGCSGNCASCPGQNSYGAEHCTR